MRRYVVATVFVTFCVVAAVSAAAQRGENEQRLEWTLKAPWGKIRRSAPVSQQKVQSFKIFDNVYYVGTHIVSSFLVTTSGGLVLIDTLYDETPDMLLSAVRMMGQDPANIKYMLITHSHTDHYGGAGKIKAATGARIGLSAEDWDVVEHARQTGTPIKRDLILKEGQPLTVGDTTFKFYLTPGHTPGATSIEFQVRDGGTSYRALVPGGLGIDVAPQWTQPYISSIEKIKRLGPWDVLFGNHPFLEPRDIEEIQKDLAKRTPGQRHPAVLTRAQETEFLDAILNTAHQKLDAEIAGAHPSGQ
jgi:metallo-beta-lactamase class B